MEEKCGLSVEGYDVWRRGKMRAEWGWSLEADEESGWNSNYRILQKQGSAWY